MKKIKTTLLTFISVITLFTTPLSLLRAAEVAKTPEITEQQPNEEQTQPEETIILPETQNTEVEDDTNIEENVVEEQLQVSNEETPTLLEQIETTDTSESTDIPENQSTTLTIENNAGKTRTTAIPLEFGEKLTTTSCDTCSKSWYRIDVKEAGYFNIHLGSDIVTAGNVGIWVYYKENSEETFFNVHYLTNTKFDSTNIGAHKDSYFYIKVDKINYEHYIQVDFTKHENWEAEANDTPETANYLSLGKTIYASQIFSDDWYEFVLESTGTIEIDYSSDKKYFKNTVIGVYPTNTTTSERIASAEISQLQGKLTIEQLPAGRYLIALSNTGYFSTEYTLRITKTTGEKEGIIEENGEDVYYLNGMKLSKGWNHISNNTYYVDGSGKLKTGISEIENIIYYFNSYGQMQTGWINSLNETYYFTNDGKALVGLNKIGNNWYYFNQNGIMQTGEQIINGKQHLFSMADGGKAVVGWKVEWNNQMRSNEKRYYYETGERAFGFATIEGFLYYFGNDGWLKKGWQTINGYKYYFYHSDISDSNQSGRPATGLQTIAYRIYYFDTSGKMQTGWQTIEGKKYYFDIETGMAAIGFTKIADKDYYFDKYGIMLIGRHQIDDKWWTFYPEGRVEIDKPKPTVIYQSHVENIGWQNYVGEGELTGTTGEAYRLEGIRIQLDNPSGLTGSIQYQTHIQNIGWQDWKYNDELSGTSGKALRLEAIRIKLTGNLEKEYDIYYRVHIQDFGWLDWAKNGETSGSEALAKRMESMEIKIIKKGDANAPVQKSRSYVIGTSINYQTHVQNIGWQKYVSNGQMTGTSGKALRLEGIKIKLVGNTNLSGNIEYRTHVENDGWQGWKKNDEMSGTSGKSYRLEAIEVRLTGELAAHYDLYYRTHVEEFGWLGWAKNGERSGSEGYARRMESMEILLVPKGEPAPVANYQAPAFRKR